MPAGANCRETPSRFGKCRFAKGPRGCTGHGRGVPEAPAGGSTGPMSRDVGRNVGSIVVICAMSGNTVVVWEMNFRAANVERCREKCRAQFFRVWFGIRAPGGAPDMAGEFLKLPLAGPIRPTGPIRPANKQTKGRNAEPTVSVFVGISACASLFPL